MTNTLTKIKTQTKCLKYPAYAIFLKSWWLIHSKYDDRYPTLVILFTPVTLVTLFWSYNQFYRVECITVSEFQILEYSVTCIQKYEVPLYWSTTTSSSLSLSMRFDKSPSVLSVDLSLNTFLNDGTCILLFLDVIKLWPWGWGGQAQPRFLTWLFFSRHMCTANSGGKKQTVGS